MTALRRDHDFRVPDVFTEQLDLGSFLVYRARFMGPVLSLHMYLCVAFVLNRVLSLTHCGGAQSWRIVIGSLSSSF